MKELPDQCVEGTKIPLDPRKRTKHHARLEITIWAEVSDEFLLYGNFNSASEALRKMEEGFEEEVKSAVRIMETIPVFGEIELKVTTRVSQ